MAFACNLAGVPIPDPKAKKVRNPTPEQIEEQKDNHRKIRKALTNLYRQILYMPGIRVPFTGKAGIARPIKVVAGHVWDSQEHGPVRSKVMVVGKMLGEQERNLGRHYVGPTGKLLLDTCRRFGIKCADWYMTNLLKTEHPDADSGDTTLKKGWINEWMPILHQELRLVRPDFILCLGADAAKAVLGKDASISKLVGRAVEYRFPISRKQPEDGTELKWHTAKVMAVVHPARVLSEPRDQDQFDNGMCRFGELIQSGDLDKAEEGLDHRIIDNVDDLRALYKEIKRDCEDNLLGLDAEWHGEHPENRGSYLRTIQISWKHKSAACILLRNPGGSIGFQGGLKKARYWIEKICEGRQLTLHYGASDCEWFRAEGYDGIVKSFLTSAPTWQEYMRKAMTGKGPLGIDTAYALHAVDETANYDLNSLIMRYTSAPRYDTKLEEWKTSYCKKNNIKAKDMEGYGMCPNEVIAGEEIPIPKDWGRKAGRPVRNSYGCYDADVVRRIVIRIKKLLCLDGHGLCCWEACWANMIALPAILEMNTTGLPIDRQRMEELTKIYMHAVDKLETTIRDWAKWPKFNIKSVNQVREFLYGEALNGAKKASPKDPPRRLRPQGAKSLRLTPIITTDKRPMKWEDVVAQHLEHEKLPSTDKLALSILAQESQEVPVRMKDGSTKPRDRSKQVTWIRDHRFISQVLKYTLRPPKWSEAGEYVTNEYGENVYDKGLPRAICTDGRVRTYLVPTKETARWASMRPSMQNFTKRREKDYKRILGPDYKYPLRSIVVAPPGHVMVAADYKGAELFMMAILSGDKRMIDHVMRNQLPEDNKDYYDIHSSVACLAFGFKCAPTKKGLDSIKKKYMRDVAKTVIFGVAYGRGAKAIALAAKEEGIQITVAEAQAVIDAIFKMYPRLVPFFAEARRRATDERYLFNVFGRARRFPYTDDRKLSGDFEREAQNYGIQSAIADVVDRAVHHLYHYRDNVPGLEYKLALQIHDDILALVPARCVEQYIKGLKKCMCEMVPIYPCGFDGVPTGEGPYYLDVDVTISTHWSQLMTPDECNELKLSPTLVGWSEDHGGWVHPDRDGKVWKYGKLHDLAV